MKIKSVFKGIIIAILLFIVIIIVICSPFCKINYDVEYEYVDYNNNMANSELCWKNKEHLICKTSNDALINVKQFRRIK